MIKRQIETIIKEKIQTGKAIILLGPRQTGKTTLIKHVLSQLGEYVFFNCDNTITRTLLESANIQKLRQSIANKKFVFIEEAQRVKNIGLSLKLIVDEMPDLIIKLLQALAFQVSSEVSFNELAGLLGIDKNTVYNYIDLLEKAFIIFRLNPLKRNLRNEISSSRKIYFYDNGIRNSLIANFNPITLRNDVGALWENFLISEREKYLKYNKIIANSFFWRTHAQQKLDYIEERGGKYYAFEFKWNPKKKVKASKTFTDAYPQNQFITITPENFKDFIA